MDLIFHSKQLIHGVTKQGFVSIAQNKSLDKFLDFIRKGHEFNSSSRSVMNSNGGIDRVSH
jgi:hypothetical protein